MQYESGKEPTQADATHHLMVCVADPDLLNLIRRTCATLPFRTHCTDSPEEALLIVASGNISLAIADQHLKNVSGIQLLKDVARISPHTARVLLAAYPENHDILSSDGDRLHGILGKPWDAPSLKRTIQAILQWQEERSRMGEKGAGEPSSYNTPTRSIRHFFGPPGEGRHRSRSEGVARSKKLHR